MDPCPFKRRHLLSYDKYHLNGIWEVETSRLWQDFSMKKSTNSMHVIFRLVIRIMLANFQKILMALMGPKELSCVFCATEETKFGEFKSISQGVLNVFL